MVMIGTISVAVVGISSIVELSPMPVTRCWLPVEDEFEKQLVERLVSDGRFFVTGFATTLMSAGKRDVDRLQWFGTIAPRCALKLENDKKYPRV